MCIRDRSSTGCSRSQTRIFTAVDGCGNLATDTRTVTWQICPPVITPTIIYTTCSASIGSITLAISGGAAPYTYSWSNGATTKDITNLAAGSYSVTVTDANGCTQNGTFTVGTNNCLLYTS